MVEFYIIYLVNLVWCLLVCDILLLLNIYMLVQ